MPYYVYAVRPFAQLTCVGEHARFAPASAQAKSLRAQPSLDQGAPEKNPRPESEQYRVMFADSALQAEDLLLAVRTPRPTGEE